MFTLVSTEAALAVLMLSSAAVAQTNNSNPTEQVKQTFEVKDQNGSVLLTIGAVRMFLSDKNDIPVFQAVVKNVSGQRLTLEALKGTVHKTDASTVEFTFALCDVRWCEFPKDSERAVSHPFANGSFTPATFDSVTFSLAWQSESQRIAAEAQAKKDAGQSQTASEWVGKIPFDTVSLGPNFLGNDIRQVISANQKAHKPKSEFETTEQYRLRTAHFTPQQYVFVLSTSPHLTDSECSYDADDSALNCKLSLSSLDGRLTLYELRRDTGSYVGQNAFGAQRTIIRRVVDSYDVILPGYSGDDLAKWETANTLAFHAVMDAKHAQDLKPNLRFALACTVTDPAVGFDESFVDPTIDTPIDGHLRTYSIHAQPDAVWLFDKRTGRIVARAGVR